MVTINMPWPPKELNPNHRAHRTKKAKIKAQQRMDCSMLALGFKHPVFLETTPVTILFAPPDKRVRDLDNLLSSCKGMLDGICDAWGVDDRNFRPITIDFTDGVKHGNVELIFSE